jgi:hypothetical protein
MAKNRNIPQVGFVTFGEINTPFERLQKKHDEALCVLQNMHAEILDAGIVIDDSAYETADAAIAKLRENEFDCLLVCVAGWVPTHAVIRVTDCFRHIPMLLWGLCGWRENGRLISLASAQAVTFTINEMVAYFSGFMTMWPGDMASTASITYDAYQSFPGPWPENAYVQVKTEKLGTLRVRIKEERSFEK